MPNGDTIEEIKSRTGKIDLTALPDKACITVAQAVETTGHAVITLIRDVGEIKDDVKGIPDAVIDKLNGKVGSSKYTVNIPRGRNKGEIRIAIEAILDKALKTAIAGILFAIAMMLRKMIGA